jgi:hypothetical protein
VSGLTRGEVLRGDALFFFMGFWPFCFVDFIVLGLKKPLEFNAK